VGEKVDGLEKKIDLGKIDLKNRKSVVKIAKKIEISCKNEPQIT